MKKKERKKKSKVLAGTARLQIIVLTYETRSVCGLICKVATVTLTYAAYTRRIGNYTDAVRGVETRVIQCYEQNTR
jgi:hypothetical protein